MCLVARTFVTKGPRWEERKVLNQHINAIECLAHHGIEMFDDVVFQILEIELKSSVAVGSKHLLMEAGPELLIVPSQDFLLDLFSFCSSASSGTV